MVNIVKSLIWCCKRSYRIWHELLMDGGGRNQNVWTWVSCVSCIGRWILYHWATWEALLQIQQYKTDHPDSGWGGLKEIKTFHIVLFWVFLHPSLTIHTLILDYRWKRNQRTCWEKEPKDLLILFLECRIS